MSDEGPTHPGNNGKGSIAEQVAGHLAELVEESREHRRLIESNELRLTGLAKVILRPEVPFSTEQAGAVAEVIQESGDHAHARGSMLYTSAERIRRVGSR